MKPRRLVTGIISAVLVVVLCAAAAGVVAMHIRGLRLLTVASGSMEPAIKAGDLVAASPLAGWPEVGQAVSYNSRVNPGEVVTHRVTVVNAKHGYVITKGENATSADNPIRSGQIIGRVVWHSALAGKVVRVLRRPAGLIMTIYVPALLIIVYEIRRLAGRYRQSHRYQITG